MGGGGKKKTGLPRSRGAFPRNGKADRVTDMKDFHLCSNNRSKAPLTLPLSTKGRGNFFDR